ncbi:MAG: alpha/beta hydrolase [Myxococcaceae bacterium]|nr:alpha/beta hydrolase [Myxococcaceae bacterium]
MDHQMSLYQSSQVVELRHAGERTQVCMVELPASASASVTAQQRRVLLIHGNPSHMDHWGLTVPALQQHAGVIAYDQPGFGRSSDFGDGLHGLERSADLAIAVLDKVGRSEPVDIVGHSHGALVALALAARSPHRVRSVVLLGTAGMPEHPMYRLFLLPGLDVGLLRLGRALSPASHLPAHATSSPTATVSSAQLLLEKLHRMVVRLMARSSFAPDAVPRSVVEDGVHAPPSMLQAMVRLARDRPCQKLADYAPRVRCPVLFIHARSDALVHISYARRLHAFMQRAGCAVRFVEIPGGHMAHFTQPQLIEPLLAAFMRENALLA